MADFDIYEAIELAQELEILLDEDAPAKIRVELEKVIGNLKKAKTSEELFNIQENLEALSSQSNLDSFSRSEIMNAIAKIDEIVNS